MSDSPSNPAGSGDGATRKRRRRRRKPKGTGPASATQPAKSPKRPKKADGTNKGPAKGDKRSRKRRSRRRGGGEGSDSSRPQQAPARDGKGRSNSGRRGEPRAKDPAATKPVDDGWQLTPPPPADALDQDVLDAPEDPAVLRAGDAAWGDDSAAETPDIKLKANLPTDVASTEWDPASAPLGSQRAGYEGQLSARIANVIAVRFVPAGRLYLYDGGDGVYSQGDRVLVEGDHGKRIATVGVASSRQPPARALKRIVRRATSRDLEPDRDNECREHLRVAKDLAKKQHLAIKVFRAQFDGPKRLSIYYACEQKTDVRALGRALSKALPVQVELRHTGARDEAKMVGGIGSCGQELCCTTWLPAFVPVSIKNAKEQGLVLNPTKVSGQCGRLKCCLVYEQALYSEMRKGLPKLGKRVITHDGFEGRVIEVDVLHQRIRVAVGRGESKVYGKGEVEPMFASQPQNQGKGKKKKKRKAPDSEGSAHVSANSEPAQNATASSDVAPSDVTKEESNDQD